MVLTVTQNTVTCIIVWDWCWVLQLVPRAGTGFPGIQITKWVIKRGSGFWITAEQWKKYTETELNFLSSSSNIASHILSSELLTGGCDWGGKVFTSSSICWATHLSPRVFRYVYVPIKSYLLLFMHIYGLASHTYVVKSRFCHLLLEHLSWLHFYICEVEIMIAPLIELWELSEILCINKNVYVCKIIVTMATYLLLSTYNIIS